MLEVRARDRARFVERHGPCVRPGLAVDHGAARFDILGGLERAVRAKPYRRERRKAVSLNGSVAMEMDDGEGAVLMERNIVGDLEIARGVV
jgi:hypothetical protein